MSLHFYFSILNSQFLILTNFMLKDYIAHNEPRMLDELFSLCWRPEPTRRT